MDELPEIDAVEESIVVVRNQRVMLDADLARLYGVKTERLNEQVRRNAARFPADFVFRLTLDEWQGMCPQIAGTLRRTREEPSNMLQIATGSQSTRRADQPPFAFTEHGCLMAANVLRAGRAVEVSVLIVRAFVRMRSALAASAELASRVDELTRAVERHGGKLASHDVAISRLLDEIRRLTRFPEAPKRAIGFTAPWRDKK